MQYILMCKSLTYAQRSSRTLERAGVTSTVSKAPSGTSKNGCSYCVKISERVRAKALGILNGAGLPPARVYRLSDDGALEEDES